MTIGFPDLNGLAAQMDTLRPAYFPLSRHFAAGLDAHVRHTYAVMLASVALGKGALGHRTAIVLELVNSALDLRDQLPSLLNRASALGIEDISEFLTLARHHKLGQAFFVDALVLSSVDGTLNEAQQALLAELADFLEITDAQLARVTFWASHILGCPVATRLPAPYLKPVLLEKSPVENPHASFLSAGAAPATAAGVFGMIAAASNSMAAHFQWERGVSVGTFVCCGQIIGATNQRILNGKLIELLGRSPADGILLDLQVGVGDKVKNEQEIGRIATLPDYCAAWKAILCSKDAGTASAG